MSSKHHERLGLTVEELEAHKRPDGSWRHERIPGVDAPDAPVIPRNLLPEELEKPAAPYPIADAALASFSAKERALIVDGVPATVSDPEERGKLKSRVDALRAEYERGGKGK